MRDGLRIQWVLDPKGFDRVAGFRRYADRWARAITTAGRGLPDGT